MPRQQSDLSGFRKVLSRNLFYRFLSQMDCRPDFKPPSRAGNIGSVSENETEVDSWTERPVETI